MMVARVRSATKRARRRAAGRALGEPAGVFAFRPEPGSSRRHRAGASGVLRARGHPPRGHQALRLPLVRATRFHAVSGAFLPRPLRARTRRRPPAPHGHRDHPRHVSLRAPPGRDPPAAHHGRARGARRAVRRPPGAQSRRAPGRPRCRRIGGGLPEHVDPERHRDVGDPDDARGSSGVDRCVPLVAIPGLGRRGPPRLGMWSGDDGEGRGGAVGALPSRAGGAGLQGPALEIALRARRGRPAGRGSRRGPLDRAQPRLVSRHDHPLDRDRAGDVGGELPADLLRAEPRGLEPRMLAPGAPRTGRVGRVDTPNSTPRRPTSPITWAGSRSPPWRGREGCGISTSRFRWCTST